MTFVVRCAIWYHLYNLKNVKNTPWRSVACNFTKINTPPWVFLMFLNCTNSTKLRNASHLEHDVVTTIP